MEKLNSEYFFANHLRISVRKLKELFNLSDILDVKFVDFDSKESTNLRLCLEINRLSMKKTLPFLDEYTSFNTLGVDLIGLYDADSDYLLDLLSKCKQINIVRINSSKDPIFSFLKAGLNKMLGKKIESIIQNNIMFLTRDSALIGNLLIVSNVNDNSYYGYSSLSGQRKSIYDLIDGAEDINVQSEFHSILESYYKENDKVNDYQQITFNCKIDVINLTIVYNGKARGFSCIKKFLRHAMMYKLIDNATVGNKNELQ